MPENRLAFSFDLSQVIDFHPPVVSPETSLHDVMKLMGLSPEDEKVIAHPLNLLSDSPQNLNSSPRIDCVLVVRDSQILGVFTEKDILRLLVEEKSLVCGQITQAMNKNFPTVKKAELIDIFAVLKILKKYSMGHLPVLNQDEHLLGLITVDNLRKALKISELFKLRFVGEMMEKSVLLSPANCSLFHAASLMNYYQRSYVIITETMMNNLEKLRESSSPIVLDNPTKLLLNPLGIITIADIIKFQSFGVDLKQITVREMMSSPLFWVTPETSLWEAHLKMEEKWLKQLIVIGKQGELVGVITPNNILEILDPIAICKFVEHWETKAIQWEQEKIQWLENRNLELEMQVQIRTAELAQKIEQERLVNTMASRIRSSLELSDILQSTVQEIRQFLQCDQVFIYQFSPDGYGKIVSESTVDSQISSLGKTLDSRCFIEEENSEYQAGKLRIINDIYRENLTPAQRNLLEELKIRSQILVPIVQSHHFWGLLMASEQTKPRHWQCSEIQLMEQLSTHITIAIQQAYALEKIKEELGERKKIEESLKASEKRFRQLAEVTVESVILHDKEKIIDVNPVFTKMFGYSLEEALGMSILNLVTQEHRGIFLRNILAEYNHPYEIMAVHQDGTRLMVEIQSRNLTEPHQKISVSIFNDITIRKRMEAILREREAVFSAMFQYSGMGIAITNLKGQFLMANQALQLMLGYPENELKKMQLMELIAPQYLPDTIALLAGIVNDQISSGTLEEQYRCRDGRLIWVRLTISTIKIFSAKSQQHLMMIIEDISTRKEAELTIQYQQIELEEMNEQLEAKIQQRTAELKTSEERFTLALCHAPITVFNQDKNLRYTWIYNSVLVTNPQNAINKTDYDLMPLETANKMTEIKQRVLNTGVGERHEISIKNINLTHHFDLTIEPLRHPETRQIIGVACAALNITNVKEAELALAESERKLLAIFNSSFEFIALFDVEGKYLKVNQTTLEIDQTWQEKDLQSIHFWESTWFTSSPSQSENIKEKFGEAVRGQTCRFEVKAQISSTLFIDLDFSLKPLRDEGGNIYQILAEGRDITELKSTQEALQKVNQELANLNAELTRATRLKDEFLANMSHELRTPLNAILGMSEGLLDEVYGSLNERQNKSIKAIEKSGYHLLELINDILDLSKIKAGKIELEITPFTVSSLCDYSLTFVRQQAFKKNLQLLMNIPAHLPLIKADERRMRQVLINLLNNAVKFTPECGTITLSVSFHPGDDKQLIFSVEDTGIGIAPENMEKLFQAFVQIDSSLNRTQEGTGLGLALVEKIVQLHGGIVTVESLIGKGSCFRVKLPEQCILEHAPSPLEQVESDGSFSRQILPSPHSNFQGTIQVKTEGESPLILLAEDHQTNIDTISDYLQSYGYRILVAQDGLEAIRLTKIHKPQLIIMDISMPKVNGLEATQWIRHDSTLASTPIIALTALAMPGDREKCLNAGVNKYMTKPVNLKQLLLLIDELTKIH